MRSIPLCAIAVCCGVCSLAQTGESTYPKAAPCLPGTYQTQSTPLTAHQKFCYFAQKRAITPSAVFGAAFSAGYAQLTKNPTEWGGGADAYGKRFGTRFAQGLSKSTAESLVGMLDHEDPRLHASGEAGSMLQNPSRIMPRLGRAVLGSIWTTRDAYADGSPRRAGIGYSRLAGAFTSGFIGMSWTPAPNNTVGQAFGRAGTGFAGYVGTSVWTEFQPDIRDLAARLIGQRHKPNI